MINSILIRVDTAQISDHGLNRDVAYSSCILEYGRDKAEL
jgi:hypothetical protein